MSIRHILTCFIILAALVGCSNDEKKENTATHSQSLAKVNGSTITDSAFNGFLKFKRIPENDEKVRTRVLEQYLEREGLAMAIEQQNLLDNELIQAELHEFKKEMLIGRYFEKFLEDKVTEQAVRNYYDTNAAEYEQRKANVAHILIRLNNKMSEPERQAKLTAAREIYSKIQAGEDFAKLAEEHSEDRISGKKGGNLGWIKEGTIDKRFSQTAFDLKPGSVSEPFETPFGFHIVKLLEAPQVIRQPLKAVAGNIRHQLRNQAKKAEMERLMKLITIEKNSD